MEIMNYKEMLNNASIIQSLANKVIEVLETKRSNYAPIYDTKLSIKEKVTKICSEIYRCDDIEFLSTTLYSVFSHKSIHKTNNFYNKTNILMVKNFYLNSGRI